MPVLPASALRGLNAKQVASLGLTPKKRTARLPGSFSLHTPRLLDDSVSVSFKPTTIVLKLGGVPENWSNSRYGKAIYQKRHSDPWRRLVHSLADQARVQARLPRQIAKHPQRRVEIMIFRCAPMFDPDGCYNAMKPVVDALKQTLIYDDNPAYLDLDIDQTRITTKAEQHIQITVRDLSSK
jgi:Holliday junction resolvase RusA-like endonuclease